jgi:high-affinity Fe2+/Pb2+ permease
MKLDTNYRRSLLVGLILFCVTGILIFTVSSDETISEFDQGLTFIIGLTAMGALSAFHQYTDKPKICDRIDRSINTNTSKETETRVNARKM